MSSPRFLAFAILLATARPKPGSVKYITPGRGGGEPEIPRFHMTCSVICSTVTFLRLNIAGERLPLLSRSRHSFEALRRAADQGEPVEEGDHPMLEALRRAGGNRAGPAKI